MYAFDNVDNDERPLTVTRILNDSSTSTETKLKVTDIIMYPSEMEHRSHTFVTQFKCLLVLALLQSHSIVPTIYSFPRHSPAAADMLDNPAKRNFHALSLTTVMLLYNRLATNREIEKCRLPRRFLRLVSVPLVGH